MILQNLGERIISVRKVLILEKHESLTAIKIKYTTLAAKHVQRNTLELQKEVLPFHFFGFVHCTGIEIAPKIICYDFTCSLKEYCMNRKAGYFKNTQLFCDIFHDYNHTCSKIHSGENLIHSNSVNSSICEQFNSYLHCIKSSATQMF